MAFASTSASVVPPPIPPGAGRALPAVRAASWASQRRRLSPRGLLAWSLAIGAACGFVPRASAQNPAAGSSSAVEFDDLLRRLPDEANAVVALHVEGIFASPLATAEGWAAHYADSYSDAPLIVPPHAKRFLLAAEFQLETMQPAWESAAMELSVDPAPEDLAKRWGGAADRLAGAPVVWPSGKLCIAKFGPGRFGVLSPASRQEAARWISRGAVAEVESFSPYLVRAVRYAAGAGPEIILAIDLQHLLYAQTVREAIERAPLFAGRDVASLVPLLTSLEGLTLGIRVTDRIQGRLLVDFGADVEPLGDLAGPLVRQSLQQLGASFPELEQWSARSEQRRIVLDGPLSLASMRRLFSVVSLDTSLVSKTSDADELPKEPAAAASASSAAEAEKLKTARASLRYYRGVSKYVSSIGRGQSPASLSQGALWVANYARRIESMPTRGVDPDLAAAAARIARRMREAVGRVYDINDEATARQAETRPAGSVTITAVPTWRQVNYGGYVMQEYAPMASANLDIGAALEKRQQIVDEAYAQGLQIGRDLLEQNVADWEQTTQLMNQRYPLKFQP